MHFNLVMSDVTSIKTAHFYNIKTFIVSTLTKDNDEFKNVSLSISFSPFLLDHHQNIKVISVLLIVVPTQQ